MEKARFITNYKELRKLNQKVNRIYFGAEFCERLLTNKNEFFNIINFCQKKNLKHSFITPFCTDYGINKVKELIRHYPPHEEIVVNDFGVLDFLLGKKSPIVLGRLITKNIKDPRINTIMGNRNRSKIEMFQKFVMNNKLFQDFLLENKIYRIELDNIFQGHKKVSIDRRISLSIYYPYVYITTTRRCLFRRVKSYSDYYSNSMKGCYKDCRNGILVCQLEDVDSKIIVNGNTSFYFNNIIRRESWVPNVDREVFFKCPI